MPPKAQVKPPSQLSDSKKRKQPPVTSSTSSKYIKGHDTKRAKTHDARAIISQTSDSALKNGELDVQSFLKAREFEIRALQDGMQRSKKSLTTRAFQQVPRDIRRRTASHNVKRVPKRLQNRAAREMKDDNTPTVTPNKRKPGSSRGRLRAETAKRLGILAMKKKTEQTKKGIDTRPARPKLRKDMLNNPPKPKSKFRKRQIHKTWLPTHLWHAKRAKMTPPSSPLWRFALPLSSTEKSYRPTHRASGARGALAWDMSYMSTIGLEGPRSSLEKVLKAVNVDGPGSWEEKGRKWRDGRRSWSGWLTRSVNDKAILIGPATVLWRPATVSSHEHAQKKPPLQQVLVRIHPSTFVEVWSELLRLGKTQRPTVQTTDLRFEIGSIDITGPGSTEVLLGILHPYPQEPNQDEHSKTFLSLAGLTNPSSLPANAILSFPISDPRLHYPPRPVRLPKSTDDEANFAVLETLSLWPVDSSISSSTLMDRDARYKATRLPSQKALNRRKSLAPPGSYPSLLPTDPQIPITLLTSRFSSSTSAQGSWTLLAPWKCILPIWYGIMHYPLASGGNPRFGGLQELKQLHFEQGTPWFPADFPGTKAGLLWEVSERDRRKAEWDRRPKGKRVEWSSLDLGRVKKGEVGRGWACDFEKVIGCEEIADANHIVADTTKQDSEKPSDKSERIIDLPVAQLSAKEFRKFLSAPITETVPEALATLRLTFTSRGVAHPCARIYRLPRTPATSSCNDSTNVYSEDTTLPSPSPSLREQWLSLLPPTSAKVLPNPKSIQQNNRSPLNTPLPQRVRLLAESLLQNPPLPYPKEASNPDYPTVPDEEDLIGFVTTGEFNLAEGKGVAVGSVVVSKVLEGLDIKKRGERMLCVVRNAGETVGRLARWEVV
jgi:ribonuclease P/MRP protein subunit POP1